MFWTNILPSRTTFGSVILAVLLVTAGCNGLGVDNRDTGTNNPGVTTTPTGEAETDTPKQTVIPEPTPTPTPTPDPNALDLRELDAGVEKLDRTKPQTGEVDRADPQDDQGYYEPVTFVGEAGEEYNIMIRGSNTNQYLELHAPNGSVVAAGSGQVADVNTDTALTNVALHETGQYTVRVYAAEDAEERFFTYSLSINRIPSEGEIERAKEGVFAGNYTYWNESEKYTWWAHQFGVAANGVSYAVDIEKPVAVNPEQDYAIITVVGGPHYDPEDRFQRSTSLAGAYTAVYDVYVDNESRAETAEWIPETVYFKIVTPKNRTLYQVNVYTFDVVESDRVMWEQWLATLEYGPANRDYDPGARNSIASLSDYPGLDRTDEVQLAPNPHVNNTYERINPTPPNETDASD